MGEGDRGENEPPGVSESPACETVPLPLPPPLGGVLKYPPSSCHFPLPPGGAKGFLAGDFERDADLDWDLESSFLGSFVGDSGRLLLAEETGRA